MVVGVVMSTAFPLYLLQCQRSKIVWYVSDDAYYYFCVAKNLGEGHGMTADGLTRTTGVHGLYTIMLAGMQRVWPLEPDAFVRRAIAVNAAMNFVTALVLGAAALRLWGAAARQWAIVLWLCNPHAILVAGIGLEGALSSLTIGLVLAALSGIITSDTRRMAQWVLLGITLALAAGARSDALLLLPLVLLWIGLAKGLAARERVGGFVVVTLVCLALYSLWPVFCYQMTGQPWSGSALAKSAWRAARLSQEGRAAWLAQGATVFGAWCLGCLIKAPMLKYALGAAFVVWRWSPNRSRIRWREPRSLLVLISLVFCVGLGLAYALFLDRTRTWYYAPVLSIMTLIAAALSARVFDESRPFAPALQRAVPVILLLVAIEGVGYLGTKTIRGRSRAQEKAVATAQWLQDNIPKGVCIGDWDSGLRTFYSGRTVINLDGLANNEMLPVLRGELPITEYFDLRRIEYLVYNEKDMKDLPPTWPGAQLEQVNPDIVRIARHAVAEPALRP